jgi:hypothetical protein
MKASGCCSRSPPERKDPDYENQRVAAELRFGVPGIKMLITAGTLAATLGGWDVDGRDGHPRAGHSGGCQRPSRRTRAGAAPQATSSCGLSRRFGSLVMRR